MCLPSYDGYCATIIICFGRLVHNELRGEILENESTRVDALSRTSTIGQWESSSGCSKNGPFQIKFNKWDFHLIK
jgi:hypothetical protein